MKTSTAAMAALALLAGTMAAHANAQSSVTLYGVADINVEYVNHIGNIPGAVNRFNSGPGHDAYRTDSGGVAGSRWGLRGEEALGNGLTSVFVLESGFNQDNGTLAMSGRLFDRQAFVGLRSASYGQLTFGRQYTSLMYAMANFSPMAFATQYDPIVATLGPNFREDNTVAYTGTFGPITGFAHWSFGTGVALPQVASGGAPFGGNGEVPGQFRRYSAYGAGLHYAAGNLGLAVAYDQFNPSMGTAAGAISSGTFKKAAIAASYIAAPVTIMAGYRWGQNRDADGALSQRDDLYWLGAVWQATPAFDLSVAWHYDDLKSYLGNSGLANPWQIALRGDYALSKRTSLYLTTAFARHGGLMLESGSTGYGTSLFLNNSYALGNGQSTMLGVALGVRHIF